MLRALSFACAMTIAGFPTMLAAATLTFHNVTFDGTTAADFSFTTPYTGSPNNLLVGETAADVELNGFNHNCNADCPSGSPLRIDAGPTIFMDIGSTVGGNEFGSFKRVIPGSNPNSGATGGFMTLAGLAGRTTPITDTFYLRLWTDGDDYLLGNVWMNGNKTISGTSTLVGLDSSFAGTASLAPVPLPAGLPLLAGGGLGLTVLGRRKRH